MRLNELTFIEMLNLWIRRLLYCICLAVQGIIGLITLGLFIPQFTYWAASELARYRYMVRSKRIYFETL